MTREEFEQLIDQDTALGIPIRSAAKAIPRSRDTFGPMTEAAAIPAARRRRSEEKRKCQSGSEINVSYRSGLTLSGRRQHD